MRDLARPNQPKILAARKALQRTRRKLYAPPEFGLLAAGTAEYRGGVAVNRSP